MEHGRVGIQTHSFKPSDVIRLSEDLCKSGLKWLILENFHEQEDKSSILRFHSKINQTFNANYRLFIITRECSDVRG